MSTELWGLAAVLGLIELVRYVMLHGLKKEILTRLVRLEATPELVRQERLRNEEQFLEAVRRRYLDKPNEEDRQLLEKATSPRHWL